MLAFSNLAYTCFRSRFTEMINQMSCSQNSRTIPTIPKIAALLHGASELAEISHRNAVCVAVNCGLIQMFPVFRLVQVRLKDLSLFLIMVLLDLTLYSVIKKVCSTDEHHDVDLLKNIAYNIQGSLLPS